MSRTIPKPAHQHQQPQQQHQRWKIAQLALISRVSILFAMSSSCSILPDFYPGDDVLQFDLRLASSHEKGQACFCLQGHGCDVDWKSRRRYGGKFPCADSSTEGNAHAYPKIRAPRFIWLDLLYAFILPPVTKWDAARFLRLSVDPRARYPPHPLLNDGSNDDHTCSNDNNSNSAICEAPLADNEGDFRRFYSSEQAHAFLPLLPLTIRYAAKLLMKTIPCNILPPTYEATVALSAIIINIFFFVIAAVSLFDLTIFILRRCALDTDLNEGKNDGAEHSKIISQNEALLLLLAKTAARLFCFNPASVFFTAAYSESMFAMLTFSGHAIAARGQYYKCLVVKYAVDAPDPQRVNGDSQFRWEKFYWIASTIFWMLASYTRSNGAFSSIWWLLVGVSKCCSCITTNNLSSNRKRPGMVIIKCLSIILFHGLLAYLVVYPIYYHDMRGHNFHCLEMIEYHTSKSYLSPAWCEHAGISSQFSLYAYVQRKHWNVGLVQYYEMKQIPNFILALPVLALSFVSAVSWIRYSWIRHVGHTSDTLETNCGGSIRTLMRRAFPWAFLALTDSSDDFLSCHWQDEDYLSSMASSAAMLDYRGIILGPKFLSYYAILAGFAFVGAFLAHVQISTRLICSSCPALYWFISALVARSLVDDQIGKREEQAGNGCIIHLRASFTKMLLFYYFALYNILGIIMHVNWLPWT